MHDYITIIHKYPMGMIEPFNAKWTGAELFQRFFHLPCYGTNLRSIVSRTNDEIVGNGRQFGQFENGNACCFFFE